MKGMLLLTKEPKDHVRSKHINKKYHYIIHRVEEGHFVVKLVSSEDNPTYSFMKALSMIKHNQHTRSIVLIDDVSFSS